MIGRYKDLDSPRTQMRILITLTILLYPCSAQSLSPTLTVMHDFAAISGEGDGAQPQASLVVGKGGVLYGTTLYGGNFYGGTVFSIGPGPGRRGWVEEVLHSFGSGSDGAQPLGALAIGSGGVLYSTTYKGGISGCGTVFSTDAAVISGYSLGGNCSPQLHLLR